MCTMKNKTEKPPWKSSRSKNVIVTVITFVICVFGCGVQLNQVGNVYFSYKTRADLRISIAVQIHLPYISLCFRFMDLITKFEDEVQKNVYESRVFNGVNGDWYYELWSSLKIRDIFRLTPKIDDIVSGCIIRNEKNLWVVDSFTKEECLKRIKSAKYIHRELICYKIDPFSVNGTFEALPIVNSIEYYNSQFMIILNQTSFEKALFMASFVHIPGSSEYFDSTQNKLEVLSDDAKKGNFFLWYTTITMRRLKPPYDTMCEEHLINTTGTEIGLRCMNQRLKRKFNKVFPFPHLYDYNMNDILLSARDLANNKTIADEVRYLRDECIKPHTRCWLLFTQSRVSIKIGKKGSKIYVYIPIMTTYDVEHVPNMGLIDFVVYACSCLGIWIGFSVWQSFKAVFGASSVTNSARVLSEHEYEQLFHQLEANRVINEQLFDSVCQMQTFYQQASRLSLRGRMYYPKY